MYCTNNVLLTNLKGSYGLKMGSTWRPEGFFYNTNRVLLTELRVLLGLKGFCYRNNGCCGPKMVLLSTRVIMVYLGTKNFYDP